MYIADYVRRTVDRKKERSVRNRWKKLRDCHRQALHRRKLTTGQAATKIKKWRYEEQMKFLLETTVHRMSDSFPADEVPFHNDEEVEGVAGSLDDTDDDSAIIKKKHHRSARGIDKTINYMKLKHEQIAQNEQQQTPDDIDLFFASAAKSVRKLPRRLQNKIKMDVLKSIADAEDEFDCYTTVEGRQPSPFCTSTYTSGSVVSPFDSVQSGNSEQLTTADIKIEIQNN